MWPGTWTFEKNRSVGLNAKLGYVPGTPGLLGEGGSVYLITGVHWLHVTAERGFDNGVVSGMTRSDHTAPLWLVGGGLEWGSRANRFGVEVRYAAYSLVFNNAADGSVIGMPKIDDTFALREWGVQVGFTKSF